MRQSTRSHTRGTAPPRSSPHTSKMVGTRHHAAGSHALFSPRRRGGGRGRSSSIPGPATYFVFGMLHFLGSTFSSSWDGGWDRLASPRAGVSRVWFSRVHRGGVHVMQPTNPGLKPLRDGECRGILAGCQRRYFPASPSFSREAPNWVNEILRVRGTSGGRTRGRPRLARCFVHIHGCVGSFFRPGSACSGGARAAQAGRLGGCWSPLSKGALGVRGSGGLGIAPCLRKRRGSREPLAGPSTFATCRSSSHPKRCRASRPRLSSGLNSRGSLDKRCES